MTVGENAFSGLPANNLEHQAGGDFTFLPLSFNVERWMFNVRFGFLPNALL
jgi:hypothetical protein